MPLTAILILIHGESNLSLWLFAALDAAFPVTWAICGDFFGRKYFATIRGNMTFCYIWGSALGPVIAGYVFDQSQSYDSVRRGLVATLSLSMLLTGLLIKPWRVKVAAHYSPAAAAATPTS